MKKMYTRILMCVKKFLDVLFVEIMFATHWNWCLGKIVPCWKWQNKLREMFVNFWDSQNLQTFPLRKLFHWYSIHCIFNSGNFSFKHCVNEYNLGCQVNNRRKNHLLLHILQKWSQWDWFQKKIFSSTTLLSNHKSISVRLP